MDTSTREDDIRFSRLMLGRSLPISIIVFMFAWAVFLFIPKSANRLPRWLRWFEDANYGINGDEYWIQPERDDRPHNEDEARSYRWRVAWSLRNANTFDSEQGVRPSDLVRIDYLGDPRVGNRPLVEGELIIYAWDKRGRRYWLYTSVYKSWIPGRCRRKVIGWKLKDALDEYLRTKQMGVDPNQRTMLAAVYSVNPLMGYSL